MDIGRSPDGSGSRPSDGANSAVVSTVPASIPNAADFLVESWGAWNKGGHVTARAALRAIQIAQLDTLERCAQIGDRAAQKSREAARRMRKHPMKGWALNDYDGMADDCIAAAEENEAYAAEIRALAQAIEARRAETEGLGAKHESAVASAMRPNGAA